jgi:hypothetical protein
MKNIHILSTDKPSRLGRFIDTNNLVLKTFYELSQSSFNIFITSDEEIKDGDWCIDTKRNIIFQSKRNEIGTSKKIPIIICTYEGCYIKKDCKKIILTTDQDLIKDSVQAIDDTFLEWFVKNPSCETIDIDSIPNSNWGFDLEEPMNLGYKIIIPKEEPKKEVTGVDDNRPKPNYCYAKEQGHGEIGCVFPSCHCGLPVKQEEPKQIKCYCGHTITCDCEPLQETIEEAAEDNAKKVGHYAGYQDFIKGVKWQKERMYSEEDMINFAHFYFKEEYNLAMMEINKSTKELLSEWFEQNKKKFG